MAAGSGRFRAPALILHAMLILCFIHEYFFEGEMLKIRFAVPETMVMSGGTLRLAAKPASSPSVSVSVSEGDGEEGSTERLEAEEELLVVGERGLILSQLSTIPHSFRPDPFFQALYDEIDDSSKDTERCRRYGFELGTRPQSRRIFFGSLVADDTAELVRMHATEVYNIYHTVSLVESATTFSNTPRTLRFTPENTEMHQLVMSGIFGHDTNVFTDLWTFDNDNVTGMMREQLQRESIMDRWLAEGMGRDDVGLVADIDETFSRDFLRAIQVCGKIHPNWNDDKDVCHDAKLVARTVQYEGTPECITQIRWFHPDLLLGKCLDGIGDPSGRVVPVRRYQNNRGDRMPNYGGPFFGGVKTHYRDGIEQLEKYPLWSAQDFRTGTGALPVSFPNNLNGWGVAFHFHNFFNDFKTLRHKYQTYGHASKLTTHPIHRFSRELDLMVRCVHGLPDHASIMKDSGANRDLLGLEYGNPIPLYFRNTTYVKERVQLVKRLVLEDEEKHGTGYEEVLEKGVYKRDTLEMQLEAQRKIFELSNKPYKP